MKDFDPLNAGEYGASHTKESLTVTSKGFICEKFIWLEFAGVIYVKYVVPDRDCVALLS